MNDFTISGAWTNGYRFMTQGILVHLLILVLVGIAAPLGVQYALVGAPINGASSPMAGPAMMQMAGVPIVLLTLALSHVLQAGSYFGSLRFGFTGAQSPAGPVAYGLVAGVIATLIIAAGYVVAYFAAQAIAAPETIVLALVALMLPLFFVYSLFFLGVAIMIAGMIIVTLLFLFVYGAIMGYPELAAEAFGGSGLLTVIMLVMSALLFWLAARFSCVTPIMAATRRPERLRRDRRELAADRGRARSDHPLPCPCRFRRRGADRRCFAGDRRRHGRAHAGWHARPGHHWRIGAGLCLRHAGRIPQRHAPGRHLPAADRRGDLGRGVRLGLDEGDLRRHVARQQAGEARVRKALERAALRDEAGAQIGGQGGGMVERAGVDPHPPRRAPRPRRSVSANSQRPWPRPGQLRHQAEEADQAFPVSRKSSSMKPASAPSGAVTDMHLGHLREQLRVAHRQPREPEPARRRPGGTGPGSGPDRRSPSARAGAARPGRGRRRRRRPSPDRSRPRRHGRRHGGRASRLIAQVASGGRLIRIASTLPPVLRPNRVPRS